MPASCIVCGGFCLGCGRAAEIGGLGLGVPACSDGPGRAAPQQAHGEIVRKVWEQVGRREATAS